MVALCEEKGFEERELSEQKGREEGQGEEGV